MGQGGSTIDSESKSYLCNNYNLTKIRDKIPSDCKIQFMNLSGNQLKELPLHLENLQRLVLSNNHFSVLPPAIITALQSYPLLNDLNLSFNSLSEFNISLQSLQTLDLTFNKISEFHYTSSTLQTLYLSNNQLHSLENLNLEQLTFLEANSNFINRIDSSNPFLLLKNLNLSSNNLTQIPDLSVFTPVLNVFSGDFNYLVEFPKFPQSITNINLAHNEITAIPDLSSYTNLNKLIINHNLIESILQLPESLTTLIAYSNKINHVTESMSCPLTRTIFDFNELTEIPPLETAKLFEISLSHNKISTIDMKFICEQVSKISIQSNNLNSLPAELFSLPHLVSLNISCNHITSLPEDLSNTRLVVLNISENPISILPKLPSTLKEFYASYCQFNDISSAFTSPINLSIFAVNGNHLTTFPQNIKAKILSASHNSLTEFPLESVTISTVINLSFNQISSIPYEFMDKNKNLVSLDLSHNCLEMIPNLTSFSKLHIFKAAYNKISTPISDPIPSDILDLIGSGNLSVPLAPNTFEFLHDGNQTPTEINEKSKVPRSFTISKGVYTETIGLRDSMEDAIAIREDLGLFILCDGHGGHETAKECCAFLTAQFEHNPNTFSEEFFIDVIRRANDHACEFERSNHLMDGCTLVLVQMNFEQKSLIVGHLGDSRALIAKSNGNAVSLTKDHKPYDKSEMEAIKNGGSYVNKGRVSGELAVARTIGDFNVKGVLHNPDIRTYNIEEDDVAIIIGCDGVFDVMTNEDVAAVAASKGTLEAAYEIRNKAFSRGSCDNISVIVFPINE